MNRNEIKPWRQVVDMTLIMILWFTISPLMSVPNRYGTYFKRKTLIWMTIFSPFTWCIVSSLFLAIGYPLLTACFPGVENFMKPFPELNAVLNYSGWHKSIVLIIYFLPLYAFCVAVLFISMAFTSWTYREASVYICEYFEPWFCVAVAGGIIIWIIVSMRRMNILGKWLSIIPIGLECWLAARNINIYFERIATYEGMGINEIFNYVVAYLINLGHATGTDYVTANIMVYIFPLVSILLVGYLAWMNYKINYRQPSC